MEGSSLANAAINQVDAVHDGPPGRASAPAAPASGRASAPAAPNAAPANDGGALRVELRDGASVQILDRSIAEVRDAGGRLLVRYVDGRAEIAAPSGDLVLSAPSGRVVVTAATDVVVTAARDLSHRAGHRADVAAERLEVTAEHANVKTGQASLTAERILTTARVLSQTVERLEVSAARLFERTRESYRETSGLLQTRAGRLRAVVEDAFSLSAKRTTIASKEETSIDGEKVLLG